MEVSGELHVPVTLPREENPLYPLDRILGGSQSRSGGCGEKKIAPAGNKTPAVQPVTWVIPTHIKTETPSKF
jgi:hypothetical protein